MAAHPQAPNAAHRTEDDDPTTDELLDLFGDEYTRQVFEAVAERPRSGRAVAEAANVSRPTAYRRLNELREAGLVRAEMTISEDGHHRERFEAVAESLSVSLDGDGIEAAVSVAD
jgi:DNA-binding transcriptional ArsR family regulator